MGKMAAGFGGNGLMATVVINDDEVQKLLKDYKKIKKYMKSTHEVKHMEGTEEKVSKLLEEHGGDLDGELTLLLLIILVIPIRLDI